jgi:hypothetical protein
MSNGPVAAAWNTAIGGIGLIDRAEIAESIADARRARRYLARFLEQYDLAAPAMGPLVRRAAAGLERLQPEPGGEHPATAARPAPAMSQSASP